MVICGGCFCMKLQEIASLLESIPTRRGIGQRKIKSLVELVGV
jgi:hypothetical protein